ncbi:MAG: cytochrome c oxidase accessory protein CcoG [Piscinibacter sp.]|jgi:cytochrome c oxidase accessory protein FixG|uniref:cytochrome c oxidase accessory protein CcoG n=1 Tax=Piscinibacter sp. TaxID=1903157 RepID=UPI002D189F1F|nr:cytochrome c oxidase accessory protein CcoG [Piscinibacter sp.]
MSKPAKVIPIMSASAEVEDSAQFVSMYQKQPTIYPRAVKGWFANWRWVFVWLTQLLFYGLPWLQWSGRQAVLFDLDAQRFYIFGLLLYPQDLIFLAALLVLSALALFFFTAVAGRLWCGYTCPQTVYTEIFMWAERKIEGDRVARMRLDQQPWRWRKIWRKGAKHSAWLSIALFTGFSFVGYFTPIRELAVDMASWNLSGWNAFWVLFYGAATYGNAGFLREQMCKYMCPYARFQSALIDKDSLIITYDAKRGDPRGSRSRKADSAAHGLGDCIDCTLCVQVCPTGIDIRNGLQNECIGCAACIDVCNDVMDKMGYAKGLIRYSTENGVVNGWTRLQMFKRALRPRVLIYGAVLSAASVTFAASVAMRSPFKFDVVKDRGALARVVEEGAVENVYRIQIMNRTEAPQTYRVAASGIDGLEVVAMPASAGPAAVTSTSVSLRLPFVVAQGLAGRSVPVMFAVTGVEPTSGTSADRSAIQFEKSTFFIPR